MISHFRQLLRGWFGPKVTDEQLDSLASDIATYISVFAEDLVSSLKDDGIQLGHRGPAVRREAMAFFAFFAKSYITENPEAAGTAKLLIEKFKEQLDPINDILREKFYYNSSDGAHIDGVRQVNRLATTIEDRTSFYERNVKSEDDLKRIMRLAFSNAHVLYGKDMAKRTISEIETDLLESSGKIKKILYPDEARNERIADWFSQAITPIQMQFDDFFYMAKHRRLPPRR